MTETELVHQLVKAINQIPGFSVWRQNTGVRGGVSFGRKGAADITGIGPRGRRIELEVKLPGKRPSPDQVAFLSECIRRGGAAGWCDSLGSGTRFAIAVFHSDDLSPWQSLLL